jgi:hypothetical protein
MEPLVIALAPDLEISAAEFVATWNRTPDCRTLAQAESAAGTAVGDRVAEYHPILMADALVVLGPIATNVTVNQIHELITKALIGHRHATKPTEVLEDREPEGMRIIIVHTSDTRLS